VQSGRRRWVTHARLHARNSYSRTHAMHIHIQTHTNTRARARTHTHTCTCAHTCTHTHAHTHIRTHTQAHAHAQSPPHTHRGGCAPHSGGRPCGRGQRAQPHLPPARQRGPAHQGVRLPGRECLISPTSLPPPPLPGGGASGGLGAAPVRACCGRHGSLRM